MPTVHITAYHVSYGLPRVVAATSAFVWTVQSTSLFLPVCHFEQNAISLAPDVRLNRNELRWVCNDEAYAPVRFEVILSTLNFEQNLIPWISFSSIDVLDYDFVVGALLVEEMRRKSSQETSTSEAMLVRGRTKEQNERSFSRSKSRHRKGKEKCWFCGKT
jgi:hypothetical protein